MRISLEALRNSPGQTVTYTFVQDAEAFGLTEEDSRFEGPADVKLEAVYRDGKIHVNGSLRIDVVLMCSRCLKTFTLSMAGEYEDEFSADEETELDVTELVRDMYYTSLPIKPLCNEACLGLCTVCGEDRNLKGCGCDVDETDPRLSVLKKLLQE